VFGWLGSPFAAPAFGVGTVLLSVAVSVPQYLHLRRGGTAAGVSLPSVLNSAVSFLAWTVFAVSIADGWLIVSSAVGLPFAVITVLAAWRAGATRAGLWLPALWVAVLLSVATADLVTGSRAVPVVIGASIGWMLVPAVLKAWTSRDVSGIAAGSWWVQTAEGVLFLGYGVAAGVSASALYGMVAATGSGAVLARLALGERGVRRVPRHRAVLARERVTAPG
jgi:uncharacterized protein with PQ loop repeat